MHSCLARRRGGVLARASTLTGSVLAALLLYASDAAADPWSGESTTLITNEGPVPSPEATLVKAAGSYDPTSGALSFAITTAAEPQVSPHVELTIILIKAPASCDVHAVEEVFLELAEGHGSYFGLTVPYGETAPNGLLYMSGVQAYFTSVSNEVSGTTRTVAVTSSLLANQDWNCTIVSLRDTSELIEASSGMLFALTAPATPSPSPPSPTPDPSTPTTAPALLSIAKPNPRTLKVGVWRTIRVTVTNTGATATSPGSLTIARPAGVKVKPRSQKIPYLAPGASATLLLRVKVTAEAKNKSTVSMTATASGATGSRGSFVLRKPQQ